MPEMDGKQVYERIVALHPGIKVIYMSGYAADIIARHGVLEEGIVVLPKPFSSHTLRQKLREALSQS